MVDRRRKRRAKNQNIFIRKSLGSNRYLVSGARSYDYVVTPTLPSCECPDWQEERPEGGCKHIIYVRMNNGSGNRQSTTYTDPFTGQTINKNIDDRSSTENRSTGTGQGNDRPRTAEKSAQSATDKQSNSGSVSNTDSGAKTESDESQSATSRQSNQRRQPEATENDVGIFGGLIGGIMLAVLVTIPIEIGIMLLNISLGTLVTRFAIVSFIIESLVILGHLTESKSSEVGSSERTEPSSSTDSPDDTNSTTTDPPDEPDVTTTDSPDNRISSKATQSESTANSNELSDEAWRRKQDQGSPNRYRGPGRY
jgi:hypothetical protein